MILQKLVELYERKEKQGDIAPYGWERKAVPFLIQLHEDGSFADLIDTRDSAKDAGKIQTIPKTLARSGKNSWQTAFLLWDHIGYALGLVTEKEKADTVEKQHLSFKQKLHNLPDDIKADKGIYAIIHFLDKADFTKITEHKSWEILYKKKPNITFQLSTQATQIIVNRPLIHQYVTQQAKHINDNATKGACLITGKVTEIARIHPKIKGVYGAQTSGASLVSFNDTAYTSFNKKQNYNAPIGEYAAFAYTTALNYLLERNSKHKLSIGSISTVFWAEKAHSSEDIFPAVMGTNTNKNMLQSLVNTPTITEDSLPDLNSIRSLFSAPNTGVKPILEDPTKFYILGLSPNVSRLSIRFWHYATVGEIAENILMYFEEMSIIMPPNWLAFPKLQETLQCMALLRKIDNIPDQLSGAFNQAIFAGRKYPQAALHKALEQDYLESKTHNKTYPYRIALIKAILIRNYGINTHRDKPQELSMALNEEINDIGYRLGRLFYVLENAQEQAHKPRVLNKTIRENYYASAACFPNVVFPRLFSLYTHHLKKIKSKKQYKIAQGIDNKIANIIEGIDGNMPYPTRLTLEQQGLFTVGYYHQKRHYVKKSEKITTDKQGEK